MLGWLRDRAALAVSRRAAAPEDKASKTGAIIALHSAGRPVWTPRTYGALARAGYTKNPIVYRAVRMVAGAAASLQWILNDGAAELDDHPLLRLLKKPNPQQSGEAFLEALYGHLLVAGNAYVEAVAVEGVVRELYALRPDRMSVVPDANGWPSAFEYAANGRTVRFSQDGDGPVAPILHIAEFHPLDDHYGFPPLEAAQVSLDVHNAASAWNKALLDNAARPSGALVYKGENGQNLSEDQYERLREELQANFSGSENAGRPLLLEGRLSWQTMSLSPKDMDFLQLKHGAAREIALAFGVPPMLLGIVAEQGGRVAAESNYAVSGNAAVHANPAGGLVIISARTITFSNSPVFSTAFVSASRSGGNIDCFSMTFTNGGTVTGKRYAASLNSMIVALGGATYLPGDVAGTTATGGEYA